MDSLNKVEMCSSAKTFLLGYTGETGKALVKELSLDNYFAKIILIGRREVELEIPNDGRFEQRLIDFDAVEKHEDAFKDCTVGFCCLGTTRGKVGADNFVKVDRDYVVNSARVARSAGCTHFQIVTATGADKNSMILYNKTKGEVEEELKKLNFDRLTIFQPGLLLGTRQERRPMETVLKAIYAPFAKLFPSAFSVHFDVLARSMLTNAKEQTSQAVEIFNNTQIHGMGKLSKSK